MYAVIKTGGKQYKVSNGDTIRVEKLDAAEGSTVSFDQVLMIADGDNVQIGTPVLAGITVSADVKKHGRGKKIEIIKFRRRKHYRKQAGHRQDYTEIEITAIGDKKAEPKKPAAQKAESGEKAAGKKPAAKKKVTAKKKTAGTKKTTGKKTTSKKSEKA